MFNMFTNTFLNFHLLHALLNLPQWDIKHTRNVERGNSIHTTRLTFHTNQVLDILLQVTETIRN